MKTSFEDNPKVDRLIESLERVASPTVVSIWGASGSGKSTLAEFISSRLPSSRAFAIDCYLSPDLKTADFTHANPQSNDPYIEGLDPSVWDQKLLNKHLRDIVKGKSVSMPIFDHTNRERTGYEDYSPAEITILEGAYSFENSIERNISRRILTKTPFHDRFIRKLIRTTYVSMRTDLEESISRYIQRTEPAADFYYKKYSPLSDNYISNPSTPIAEFLDYSLEQPDEMTENRRYIMPRVTSGSIHEGESLSIEKQGSSEYVFRYDINDRVLIQSKVGESVVALLNRHYTSV